MSNGFKNGSGEMKDNLEAKADNLKALKAENRIDSDNELYSYIKDFAILKLKSETKRENFLIRQSTSLQIISLFTIIALFITAPTIIEYRGKIPLEFLLFSFSIITIFLLISLLFALLVQKKELQAALPDVDVFMQHMIDNYEIYLSSIQRDRAFTELVGEIQKCKNKINNKRTKKIDWSMWLFYAALSLIIVFIGSYIIFR